MAGGLNPQNVSDMISALAKFKTDASQAVMELEAAGNECVENLEGDPTGPKANASLQEKTGKIKEQIGRAAHIAMQLYEELEAARRAASKADDF